MTNRCQPRQLKARERGSQIVELAIVLPFLVVLTVGIFDFGAAFNLKQKLNNTAREGARFATNEPTVDLGATEPASVQAVRDVMFNYVTDAKVVTLSACSSPALTSPGVLQWRYTYTGCPGTLTFTIDRGYTYTATIGGSTVTVPATHVTVSYTYSWLFGRVVPLIASGSSLTLPATISSEAVYQNLF
jgi:Flp pilus assembly protein TadG